MHGGPSTGRALVGAPVDGIAFTGSAEVGREIARKLVEGPYARPALTEMGGKNPAVVTASADLDAAAEGLARAAFGLSGQKCCACSRAIVLDGVHDELLERLCAFTATLPVGDPSERESLPRARRQRAGPSSASARASPLPAATARSRPGAACPDRRGWFVEPTVVGGLPLGHPLTREELFLPS